MSRDIGLFLLLAVSACGGSDRGTEPKPSGPIRLSVVAGDAQSDTIQALLTTPIRIQAVRVNPTSLATTPAANQLVSFVVVEPNCGRAFAGSAITDASGNATDRWELGTKSGACHMEVRAVDQVTGQPVVFATATATINPGAVDTLNVASERMFFLSSRVSIRPLVSRAIDRVGNTVQNPALLLEAPLGWLATGDSLFNPATEMNGVLTVRSGNRSATIAMSAVRDLRLYKLTTSLKCGPLSGVSNDAGIYIDSVYVPTVTVDTVKYQAGYDGTPGGSVGFSYLVWSGSATYYLRNGTTESRQLANVHQEMRRQAPGSITWLDGNWNTTFTQVSDNPIAYSGERLSWCFQWGASLNPQRMMVLTATP